MKSMKTNEAQDKSDLESLFVDCIEDVRKQVMKRRLKSELLAQKKIPTSLETESAAEFESSLMKLASLAKDRIKYTDFSGQDRFNILDLFVNNQKTLVNIY